MNEAPFPNFGPTSVYNAVLINDFCSRSNYAKNHCRSATSDLLIDNKFVSLPVSNSKLFFLDSLLTVIKPVCSLVLFCILTGFIHTL